MRTLRYFILSSLVHLGVVGLLLWSSHLKHDPIGPQDGSVELVSFALIESQPQVLPKQKKSVARVKTAEQAKSEELASQPEKLDSSQVENSADSDTEQAPLEAASGAKGESALSQYLWSVRTIVEKNKFYPLSAKRLRQEDTVKTIFILGRDGKVRKIESLTSSYSLLAEAAKKLLTEKATFPAFPQELQMQSLKVSLDIRFYLN